MAGIPIPEAQSGERFLLGKIPMEWLYRAGQLTGKALHLGTSIWHLAHMERTGKISISVSACSKRMGFERSTGMRAVQALHDAGLITKSSTVGRNTEVELHWPPHSRRRGGTKRPLSDR